MYIDKYLIHFLIVLLLLILAGILGSLNDRRKRRRRNKDLEKIVSRMGLFMSREKSPVPVEVWKNVHLLKTGYVKGQINNLIQGSKYSFDVVIFDQSYFSADTAIKRTVIIFQSDQLNLPHFILGPLKIKVKGYEAINFETFPKFSSQYNLVSSDKEQIRTIFNTKVLSYFQNKKGWYVEGLGTRLFIIHTLVPPKKLREFYEQTHEIFRVFL